jgi:type II secretion system protein H
LAFFSQGFTLLEIMVVVVIIGIIMAVAVANLFVDEREQLRQEAERAYTLLERVRDESALGGRAIAVRMKDNQLELLERDPHAVAPQWQPVALEGLKTRPWPDGVAAELRIAGAIATDDAAVTFLPGGIGSPFTLSLASAHHRRIIRGDPLGNLSLQADDGNVR